MKRKTLTLLTALLALVLLITACNGSKTTTTTAEPAANVTDAPEGTANDTASGTVTVYTSVPQALIDQYQEAFNKVYPDIKVEVYRAVTNDILAKLKAEQEANANVADVIWVADESSAVLLKEQGYLTPYKSTEDAGIQDSMKDSENYYYGSRVINMVLAYNTSALSEAPSSWNDLLDLAHKDKIGMASVESGTSYAFVGNMAAADGFGWEFFESFKANGGVPVKGNSDVVSKLAAGELVLTPTLDYMVKAAKDNGSPVDYVVPEEGAVMIVSPICLANHSKNEKAGQTFIDYVLSLEGQTMLGEQDVVSVRTDVNPPQGVPSVSDLKAFPADNEYLNEGREEINGKYGDIFGH